MALPRQAHLDAALHVVSYLKRNHNACMVFDPTYPEIDQSQVKVHDWVRFYGKESKGIPENAPELMGKPVDLRMMVVIQAHFYVSCLS